MVILGFFMTIPWAIAQVNTEIYLFDLSFEKGDPVLTNPKNISNNEGYDNQPSFLDDHTVLFSSTRDGQTDILQFNITEGSTSQWLTNTRTGSEYSPLKMPGKNAISAIRLDLDGLQRLYEYPLGSGESKPISDLKIGYHLWFDSQLILATVLVGNRMDLAVIDLREGTHHIVWNNVGRSLHRIPGSGQVSFISKTGPQWEVMSLDPRNGETKKLADCLEKVEDVNWLDEKKLIGASGKSLYVLDLGSESGWRPIMEFGQDQIHNISRIAINPGRNRLAFVAEESPAVIVQKQHDAFNNGDLEEFMAWHAEDVVVQGYPNKAMYLGKPKLFEAYQRIFSNTLESKVEVVKRIVINNLVIDEEITSVDGRKGHQVAIYEVMDGRITSKTLLFPEQPTLDAETIVQEQHEAYNQRDIDAFLSYFSDRIQWFHYPDQWYGGGKRSMRVRFDTLFGDNPQLSGEVKNRIVIGNKVLDEKYVSIDSTKIHTVDIYEVENGEITKVTTIQ